MSNRNNRTQTQTEIIKGTYRRTRMGGFTEPLALKLLTENRLVVVLPIRKEFSQSGNHGEYYFPNDVDILLHFEVTNSGHRAVFIRCLRAPQEVCNSPTILDYLDDYRVGIRYTGKSCQGSCMLW